MLTMREGGAVASAPKRAEDNGEASDVGINDLGDGGATEVGGPACAGLVLAAGGRHD